MIVVAQTLRRLGLQELSSAALPISKDDQP